MDFLLFVRGCWEMELLGGLFVILTSLGFPQPLIARYLIEKVILSRQLPLLVGAILLVAGIALQVRQCWLPQPVPTNSGLLSGEGKEK